MPIQTGMTRPRARIRIVDFIVTMVAMGLIMAPVTSSSFAADPQLVQPMSVTQEVVNTVGASRPVTGNFDVDRNGVSTGSITWDAWATANGGFKLTVNSDRSPAMSDTSSGISIADYSTALSTWGIGAGERRFGFSAQGKQALAAYDDGRKWRGFSGSNPIEVARRRAGAVAQTRTEVLLRTEMKSALPAGSKPEANVIGTVTENL